MVEIIGTHRKYDQSCKNKSALFILLTFHSENSQKSSLSLK